MKKIKKWMNKKAEMTSKELLGVIILIVIIAVLLLWLSGIISWGRTSIDKDTCHTSIVLRGTINEKFIQSSKVIPLKCQTEKICLSVEEDCNKFKADTNIKLSKDKEEAKNKILDTIANAMYDCHSMLGEGKLNFMPNTIWKENYCLICSRFALDEKAKQEVSEIGYGELYQYLGEKKTPDGKSYLEYLYPGWKNWEESKKVLADLQSKSDNKEFRKLSFENWKINLSYDNGYAVVGQMAPRGTLESWITGGTVGTVVGVVAGVIVSATGIGAPLGVGLIAGSVSGGAMFVYRHPGGKFEYTSPYVIPYNLDTLKSLKCTSFETAP